VVGGQQSLTLDQFAHLMDKVRAVAKAVGGESRGPMPHSRLRESIGQGGYRSAPELQSSGLRRVIGRFFGLAGESPAEADMHVEEPLVRGRAEHCISRQNIDPDALKVLYHLSRSGYTAYLVGGGVRDLLLGRKPKDFDIGTDAHPRAIKSLFRNCFLIGRRFRLAHIKFGAKIIETSTFRREPDPAAAAEDEGALHRHDNTFGTPAQDARRRDSRSTASSTTSRRSA